MADLNTNTKDFLFELGAEELPSGQIRNISDYFISKIKENLDEAEVQYGESQVFFTPRRITCLIKDINTELKNKELEIKGPPEKIAKAEDESLTQAALGFLKKNNAAEKDSFFKDGYLYLNQLVKAQNPADILAKALPEIIASTPGVRFMRWGNSEVKFARPPQWICTLLGSDLIEFQLENIKTKAESRGHRFLRDDQETNFKVKNFEDYKNELAKREVILDQAERRQMIVTRSEELAKSIGAEVIFDDELLDEITLITENPSPILCDFDPRFLEIPECVLTTVMIQHQRYLPLRKNSKLIEKFIAVSNNSNEAARVNIKEGNEKVIVPRFKDAEFFVEEDNKISLEDRLTKLEKLNFLKGNMQQKTQRLVKISKYIAEEISKTLSGNPMVSESVDLQDLEKAALLAKADLSTNLVFEFTELQGEIGGIYAGKQGLNKNVQDYIGEHYLPRFADDIHPKSLGAKVIGVADRIDNLVCAFALGKIPSGSADPFALRRQANAMLEIIVESRLIIDLEALIAFVCGLQKDEFGNGDKITKIKGRGEKRQEVTIDELNWDGTEGKLVEFLESRLEFVFEQRHSNKGINKSVLSIENALKELNKRHMMIHFFSSLSSQNEFDNLVEAVNRVINICRDKEFPNSIKTELFENDYEKEFYEISQKLNSCEDQNLSYDTVYDSELLFDAAKAINKFFDNVLVNSEKEEIRANRQALVAYANRTFKNLADFSLIRSC